MIPSIGGRCARVLGLRIALAWGGSLSAAFGGELADGVRLGRALGEAVYFHAGFDGTADARADLGDGRIHTAESLDRRAVRPGLLRPQAELVAGAGRLGGCLRFLGNADEVLLYRGSALDYRPENWSGTFSFWMRLAPDDDLEPGFSDPLLVTDRAWNDAAFFVDFDKDVPRTFRLGAFPNYRQWNPRDIAWDDWPVAQRPMVVVARPPFARDRWTHVAFVFENVNAVGDVAGRAALHLDGLPQGELRGPMRFDWDRQRAALMLGIAYVGDFDELLLFRRALQPEEIAFLAAGGQPAR